MLEEGINFASLSIELSIGKNQLAYWKGKGDCPKDAATIRKLAERFNCSEAYLLGYSEERKIKASPVEAEKHMAMEQKINMAASYRGMSQAALARAIGMTPSNFNQKIKRDTFSMEDLEAIASALGAVYISAFEFPDGT